MSIRARCALMVLVAALILFVDTGDLAARECANAYTARRGDSWWSIAAKSNITLKQILALNRARIATVILIGDEICVPVINQLLASQPTLDKVVKGFARNEIETIIREIWPDDLENQALAIAQRESNLKSWAVNRCCYGLFQIYYRWHKDWLPSVGVTSAEQLFDPILNTRAAYKLYQRNGWGPWKLGTAG